MMIIMIILIIIIIMVIVIIMIILCIYIYTYIHTYGVHIHSITTTINIDSTIVIIIIRVSIGVPGSLGSPGKRRKRIVTKICMSPPMVLTISNVGTTTRTPFAHLVKYPSVLLCMVVYVDAFNKDYPSQPFFYPSSLVIHVDPL